MSLGPVTQININGVSISCNLYKNNLCHTPIKLYPQSIKYDSNAVILEDFVCDLG